MQLTRISLQFKNENAGIDVVENECSNTICCIGIFEKVVDKKANFLIGCIYRRGMMKG